MNVKPIHTLLSNNNDQSEFGRVKKYFSKRTEHGFEQFNLCFEKESNEFSFTPLFRLGLCFSI